MLYQYYDPHPHICRMKQYECCKNYQNCPLYNRCKELKGYSEAGKVCKQDCATCDYTGCTMSMEKGLSEPLYINGRVMTQILPLPIDQEREKERAIHKITHRQNYEFYNTLFGDYRERKNKQQRNRYHADEEFYRQRAREWYRTHYVKQEKTVPEAIMPKCKFDCFNCQHGGCILPEDWRHKANMENWKKNNPNYFAEYREQNKELLREKGKKYYEEHREERLAALKLHRQKPEIKAQRAAYDKEYRKIHPEKERERQRRYYESHKDEINARRRQQRAELKKCCYDHHSNADNRIERKLA